MHRTTRYLEDMMNALLRPLMATGLAFCLNPGLHAQAPSTPAADREVLAVVDHFFSLMSTRDSAGMAAILEPEGVLFAVPVGPEARLPKAITHRDYLSSLGKSKGTLLERYWTPSVHVDGAVATVWAPYDFHVDGTFSHCGNDVFTLVHHPDGWKIAGGVFSMRQEECPASPLGTVAP
jgi:hypothetical protein